MGYINSPSNIITVDTILTKKGRELLSAGKPLNITKFALSDDEIDYSLWNTGHPSGSDYYGVAIESLPLIEAVPDESKVMKSKLVTLAAGSTTVPIIGTAIPNITFASVINSSTAIGQNIKAFTQNGNNDTLGYQFTIAEPQYFQYIQNVVPVNDTNTSNENPAYTSALALVKSIQEEMKPMDPSHTSAGWAEWKEADDRLQAALVQLSDAQRNVNMVTTRNIQGQAYTIASKEIKLYPVVGSGAAAYYGAYALAGTKYVETIVTISGRETGGYTTVKVRINFD
ncbi:MAG: hypothetical protein WC306_03235 [Candidatus Paceibacterota bacterium]|jgi:hypothetical protein